MEVLIAIVIVALVALFVVAPLRHAEPTERAGEDPLLADLEARKQVKYREIRDTELDHAQGKLSDEEFARQDAELRGEAIEILKLIDAAEAGSGTPDPADDEKRRYP